MNIAVLSDFHLGNGSYADDFIFDGYYKKTSEEKIIKRLELELEKYDLVVLNGDVYELWQFSQEDINLAYPKLTELIRNCEKIKFIKGNHDWTLNKNKSFDVTIKNASIKLKQQFDTICNVRLKEANIHIEHGHKNDPSMTSTYSIIMNWLFGWIERIIPPFDSWATGKSDEELFENVEKLVLNYFSLFNADELRLELVKENDVFISNHSLPVLVLGHTHAPGIWRVINEDNKTIGIYCNSGSCVHGNYDRITMKEKLF